MKIVKFDVEMIKEVVRDTEPGLYTLRQLLGDMWELVLRRRWYGKQFKLAVDNKLPNVRFVRRLSNRSRLYEVFT